MTIQFFKNTDKRPIITCIRTDGSQTWQYATNFFIAHDLMHFAVETVLDMKTAFYGMLDAGAQISDFEAPKDRRAVVITEEAIQAEELVNLFLIESREGVLPDFNETLRFIYEANRPDVKAPILLHKHINAIRAVFSRLKKDWDALKDGESLSLTFKA